MIRRLKIAHDQAVEQRAAAMVIVKAMLVHAPDGLHHVMKAAVIHERLAQEYGFTGNYQRVKLYVQTARARVAEELGITPKELAGMHRRFEVVPGAQAQVDWGGATRGRAYE